MSIYGNRQFQKTEQSVKQQKQEERKKKLIGQIIPHNGHSIFKINEETLEISEPKYIKKAWIFNGENKPEVLVEKGFFYVSALNEKNALKKYNQGRNGSKDISDAPLSL
jgi:hypothetical protein